MVISGAVSWPGNNFISTTSTPSSQSLLLRRISSGSNNRRPESPVRAGCDWPVQAKWATTVKRRLQSDFQKSSSPISPNHTHPNHPPHRTANKPRGILPPMFAPSAQPTTSPSPARRSLGPDRLACAGGGRGLAARAVRIVCILFQKVAGEWRRKGSGWRETATLPTGTSPTTTSGTLCHMPARSLDPASPAREGREAGAGYK